MKVRRLQLTNLVRAVSTRRWTFPTLTSCACCSRKISTIASNGPSIFSSNRKRAATAVAARFLFEEKIEGPFDAIVEIFREQQAQLVSVGNVHRRVETARTKFVSWSRRTFIVKNSTATNFVFGKDGRI